MFTDVMEKDESVRKEVIPKSTQLTLNPASSQHQHRTTSGPVCDYGRQSAFHEMSLYGPGQAPKTPVRIPAKQNTSESSLPSSQSAYGRNLASFTNYGENPVHSSALPESEYSIM